MTNEPEGSHASLRAARRYGTQRPQMRAPQAQRRDGVSSGQAVPGLSCVCAAGWLWPVHVRARDSCMRGGVNPRPEASGGRGRDGLTHVWSESMYEHQGGVW